MLVLNVSESQVQDKVATTGGEIKQNPSQVIVGGF